jgi:cytochrome b561
MDRNMAQQRYTSTAIAFHWIIALFIIFNMCIGSFMESLDQPLRTRVVSVHASVGMSVLGLALLRILWRITHRPPEFSATMATWEKWTAQLAHAFLYFLMVAMPLTGFSILSSNAPRPPGTGIRIWVLTDIPRLSVLQQNPDAGYRRILHDQFVELHAFGAWILFGLLILHVLGALKHQYVDRHPEFARMGIGRLRPVIEPHAAAHTGNPSHAEAGTKQTGKN